MKWLKRLWSRTPEVPEEVQPPAPGVTLESLPQYIAESAHLTAPEAIERLRQARMHLGDTPELLVALARRQPDDARALWMQLTDGSYAAEAYDALAESALSAEERQTCLERAAALAPQDAVRLARCIGRRTAQPPQLPLGPWPPILDRLPPRFTPVAPLARGPDGLVIEVTDGQRWTAKALHPVHANAPVLTTVFECLEQLGERALPGLATIVHADASQGLWVRTAGVTTLDDAPRADLSAVVEAVERLHAEGLAHGHLCARNIIIDSDGQARLTDWGLSRLRGVVPTVEADRAALSELLRAAG